MYHEITVLEVIADVVNTYLVPTTIEVAANGTRAENRLEPPQDYLEIFQQLINDGWTPATTIPHPSAKGFCQIFTRPAQPKRRDRGDKL